jgi:hypothetical protein
MRLRRLLPLLLLTMLVLPACGSTNRAEDLGTEPRKQVQPQTGGDIMPASDMATVEQARRQLESACPKQLISDTPGDPQPAIRTFIREQRLVGPNAVFESGNVERALPMSTLMLHEARVLAQCGLTGPASQLRRAAQPVSG